MPFLFGFFPLRQARQSRKRRRCPVEGCSDDFAFSGSPPKLWKKLTQRRKGNLAKTLRSNRVELFFASLHETFGSTYLTRMTKVRFSSEPEATDFACPSLALRAQTRLLSGASTIQRNAMAIRGFDDLSNERNHGTCVFLGLRHSCGQTSQPHLEA